MELPGHVGAALTAYAPIGFATSSLGYPRVAVAGAVVAAALSSLPDCDLYVPRTTHRGCVHTVWFAVSVGFACAVLARVVGRLGNAPEVVAGVAEVVSNTPAVEPGTFWFVVGTTSILSHLAADGLTPMGVAPLAPVWRRQYSLHVTRSASQRANRHFLLLGLGATGVALGGAAVLPIT